MKTLLLSLLLLISTDPRQIAKINSLKKEAAKEFSAGNYESAIKTYQLLDSMGVDDPALKLNLAHAYYNLKDTTGAISNYQSVLTASDKKLRSIAYQQLGVMKKETKKYEESLQDLKSSLKADPTNEGARFDYELVKKLLKEQLEQEQDQSDENQDQENEEEQENEENQEQEQENQDNKEGEKNEEEGEEGEEQESDQEQEGEKKEEENKDGEEQEADQEPTPEEQMQEKLEEMNISPEKAQMILEAMRNNEVQYLQQQKRKATKRPPSGKPDW